MLSHPKLLLEYFDGEPVLPKLVQSTESQLGLVAVVWKEGKGGQDSR